MESQAAKETAAVFVQGAQEPLLLVSGKDLGNASIAPYALPELRLTELVHNLQHSSARLRGGQAEVHLTAWENESVPHKIDEERLVAIKHVQVPLGGGLFEAVKTRQDFDRAREFGSQQLRTEINLLGVLRNNQLRTHCGSRVIEPLAVVRWPGVWQEDEQARASLWWEPTYAYVMPAYERGSVTSLVGDVPQQGGH